MAHTTLTRTIWLVLAGTALAGGTASAGWRNWWSSEDADFPGSTQKDKYGRQWPPYYRPPGKEAKFVQQYHYSYYWPHPHYCEDRGLVRGPFNQQTANGWITETTLYSQHFDPNTNELNSAGKTHLEWILFQVPTSYRTVHIAPATSPEATQARVSYVQGLANEMVGNAAGGVPPILVRNYARPNTTPAQDIDLLRRRYLETTPSPRLPVNASSEASSTTGTSNM